MGFSTTNGFRISQVLQHSDSEFRWGKNVDNVNFIAEAIHHHFNIVKIFFIVFPAKFFGSTQFFIAKATYFRISKKLLIT
jgi:hypothetical protein